MKAKAAVSLSPGDLVKIIINDINYIKQGYATGSKVKDGLEIYSEISLEDYPSSDDFTGSTTLVKEGDIAMIVRFIGRPFKIPTDPSWFEYDIYEIIVKGQVRQAFKNNLFNLT